jgi:hypothetical protein
MVICIIALPVLAILGLFSLRYRILAREAFKCLGRTIILKPCDTGLDVRIKSKFTAKLMWWPWLARSFFRYFEVLSWVFVILTLLSVAGTGYGLYNYFVYGNCNGPDSSAFCVFNIVHSNQQGQCSEFAVHGEVNASKVNFEAAVVRGDPDSILSLHEYGCYSCPYTKDAEPAVKKILQNYPDVKLVYHDVPLEIHNYSIEAGEAAICAGEQSKYWAYHDILFDRQKQLNDSAFELFAQELGLDIDKFNLCRNSTRVMEIMNISRANALDVGIYGTPTFIMGDDVLVGPQSYKTLKNLVEAQLGKA